MKNLIKFTTICSLLIVACFMISACGGDAEHFVQGDGQVDVSVKDNTGAFVSNVEVRVTEPNGKFVTSAITTPTGILTFQLTVGTVYTFTFTDKTVPPRFATMSATKEPRLTTTEHVDVVMQP